MNPILLVIIMIGGILIGVIEILGRAYISPQLADAIVFAETAEQVEEEMDREALLEKNLMCL